MYTRVKGHQLLVDPIVVEVIWHHRSLSRLPRRVGCPGAMVSALLLRMVVVVTLLLHLDLLVVHALLLLWNVTAGDARGKKFEVG